jgi:hypothetical protein
METLRNQKNIVKYDIEMVQNQNEEIEKLQNH